MPPPQRAALPSRRLPADPALTSTRDASLWPVDALFTRTCWTFADFLYSHGGIFMWDGASETTVVAPVSAKAGTANATSGAEARAVPRTMPAATFLTFVMMSAPFLQSNAGVGSRVSVF